MQIPTTVLPSGSPRSKYLNPSPERVRPISHLLFCFMTPHEGLGPTFSCPILVLLEPERLAIIAQHIPLWPNNHCRIVPHACPLTFEGFHLFTAHVLLLLRRGSSGAPGYRCRRTSRGLRSRGQRFGISSNHMTPDPPR